MVQKRHNPYSRIKRAQPMGDVVVNQLRTAILSGALRPGSRIKQEALADRLGVSRAPVRQALLMLEREGLIRAGANGTIVAPVDRDMILDLYAFRGIIESSVASTLATRSEFDPKRHNRIVAAGRRAAKAGDISRLIELDLEFHTSLYDAVGNRVLSDVMRGQWRHVRRVMVVAVEVRRMPQQIWSEHAAILDAIVARDPDAAGRSAVAHTRAACQALLENLSLELQHADGSDNYDFAARPLPQASSQPSSTRTSS